MSNKLILAIIFNAEAVEPLSQALVSKQFSVTKMSSTGGFLRRQTTTFMIGVDEIALEQALGIIRAVCRPYSKPEGHAATLFVLDVADFDRV